MTNNEMIMVIAVTFIAVGIPLGGLVIRYALRPLIQDITTAIRGREDETAAEMMRRLDRIESRLEEQSRQTHELVEAARFDRELTSGPTGKVGGSSGDAQRRIEP